VSLEGDGVSDAHATGRLEDLSISVLAIDTDDFAHQWHTTDGDVAYFVPMYLKDFVAKQAKPLL